MGVVMKSLNMLVLAALVGLMSSAYAEDSCEVMRKIDGVLTSVKVPCSQVKRSTTPEQEAAIQSQRAHEAEQKKICGADFGKLRIGMTMDRYEQCTEAVDYVTKTVTKDGEVETYLGTFYLISARNGRIVAFTRRVH